MIDVAIVGAGAAGISAARRLTDRGHEVLLVEALDRLGGRAWTATVEGMPLDLGCGWLHSAERNPWVGVAAARGHAIDRSPSAWREQYRNLGFPAADQQAAGQAFAAFSERLEGGHPSDRAAALIDPDSPWTGFIEALSGYINGAQLDQLSIADYLAYDDAASETNWRLPGGYGALIAAEAAGLAVRLSAVVGAIEHIREGVRLETDAGAIEASAAIVTVSTNMLAERRIALPASLDPAIEAAARVPLGLADKLFLRVADPGSLPRDGHLLGDPRSACTGSYYLRPFGLPVIEGFFGGAAARALEEAGPAAMADFAIGELRALFGADAARGLAPIAASAWAHVPGIGGSYSHALPGHAGARALLAERHDARILLAGEACSVHDFSTAHGARASGLAAAGILETELAR